MLVTRFELFLRGHAIGPIALAKKAVHSRQHLLRLRRGESLPARRCILTLMAACEAITSEPVAAGMLFERADALLGTARYRLADLHAGDLACLATVLREAPHDGLREAIRATAVATETAVAYLLRAGRKRIDVRPAAAAEIYTAAMAMASSLTDSRPELVAAMSAEALKGRANALRHLGRFDEALTDLANAAKRFRDARYCEAEAGQVEYTRAGVLFRREQWSEAAKAARSARWRFLAAKDRRRVAHAEIVEACIRFEEGDTESARKLFHQLRVTLRDLRDADALARVWLNLGACEIRRGDRAMARHWLSRASAAFRAQANTTEFLRTRWNMGKYVARFRGPARGIALLQRVQCAFAALGMNTEAGCVGLDLLELMIQLGAPAAAIRERAREVAKAFTAAGMRVSAATALEHLRTLHSSAHPDAVLAEMRTAVRAAEETLSLGSSGINHRDRRATPRIHAP